MGTNTMKKEKVEAENSIPLLCPNCGAERVEYIPGAVDDHCLNCGLKEGCCNVYDDKQVCGQ